jgi:hypothetical protein
MARPVGMLVLALHTHTHTHTGKRCQRWLVRFVAPSRITCLAWPSSLSSSAGKLTMMIRLGCGRPLRAPWSDCWAEFCGDGSVADGRRAPRRESLRVPQPARLVARGPGCYARSGSPASHIDLRPFPLVIELRPVPLDRPVVIHGVYRP